MDRAQEAKVELKDECEVELKQPGELRWNWSIGHFCDESIQRVALPLPGHACTCMLSTDNAATASASSVLHMFLCKKR